MAVEVATVSDQVDIHRLKEAYGEAKFSPDLSTQLGAVLYATDGRVAAGCNTLPRGVKAHPERLERPAKYVFTEHAERSAILKAAKYGIRTEGATLYCPWFSCAECSRAIICAGITRVVGHKEMFDGTPERWAESIANGWTMMQEAGIQLDLITAKLDVEPIRFHGELWYP